MVTSGNLGFNNSRSWGWDQNKAAKFCGKARSLLILRHSEPSLKAESTNIHEFSSSCLLARNQLTMALKGMTKFSSGKKETFLTASRASAEMIQWRMYLLFPSFPLWNQTAKGTGGEMWNISKQGEHITHFLQSTDYGQAVHRLNFWSTEWYFSMALKILYLHTN